MSIYETLKAREIALVDQLDKLYKQLDYNDSHDIFSANLYAEIDELESDLDDIKDCLQKLDDELSFQDTVL